MSFGQLERTKGAKPMADINMTPLVDVMLVLVVILLITAPLLSSAIRLDLPKAQAAMPSDAAKFVTLVVDQAGQLYLNDKKTDAQSLALALQTAASLNPDTEIQLRADETVPYGKVVEVMGLAQKAGLNRIGFVAEAKK